jgi:hypothetical protein
MMSVAETRLVAAGHMLPSSAPHTPGSKGHMSAPETPCDTASTPTKIGVATAPHKHNSAAVAYYRHATQRQQQQTQQQQLQRSTSGFAAEAGGEEGDALIAVQDLDPAGLIAQLQALHQQQHQALLAGSAGTPDQPLNGGSSSSAAAPAGRSVLVTSVGSDQGAHHGGDGASVCASIESIQNVLTALFVASMGLIMSPVFLWHHTGVLLCGTLLVTLVKAGVVTGVVRMFGVPLRLSLAVGLSMAHIGEFSFVLLSMANQLKLLSTQVSGTGAWAWCRAAGPGACSCMLCAIDRYHRHMHNRQRQTSAPLLRSAAACCCTDVHVTAGGDGHVAADHAPRVHGVCQATGQGERRYGVHHR